MWISGALATNVGQLRVSLSVDPFTGMSFGIAHKGEVVDDRQRNDAGIGRRDEVQRVKEIELLVADTVRAKKVLCMVR